LSEPTAFGGREARAILATAAAPAASALPAVPEASAVPVDPEVPAVPAVDFAPGLERAFERVPEEGSHLLHASAGTLPAYLHGTWYCNGPARFHRGGMRYRHWLDGDGMVCALAFGDGGAAAAGEPSARFTSRFVRSDKWRTEEEAGRFLYRAFGTAFAGDRLVRGIALESPVNVSVLPFAGTLLALGEQVMPWELDPATLATRGRFNFGGGLNPVSPFAAHAKIDPETGELFNFGLSYSAAHPRLQLYRFDAAGRAVYRRHFALPHACSLHDFCLTPRHAVFYVSPYLLDMAALARDGRTPMQALSWEPRRGSRLLVVERAGGELVATVPVGEGYVLHTINGWEEASGRLVLDVLELDRPVYDQYQEIPDLFTGVGPGRPVRLTVDLDRAELVARREIDYALAPDFPAIDPRLLGKPADDLWLLGISATGRPGRKFIDQLVHARWSRPSELDVWQAPRGHYLAAEPVFVPDPAAPAGGPGGPAGTVICPRFDAERGESAFLLFDAAEVAAGPRAVLPLPSPMHLAFHAIFAPRPAAD
jgi:all-trans-8'-apo-beta-carotenal 15,15'-oxygenase